MAANNSGLLHYLDLLGVPRESMLVHYGFNDPSGVPNSAPSFPQSSGVLSSIGGFFSQSGSGNFTGQSLSIADSTGLNAETWTHIAIIERQTSSGGVVFSNLATGAPPSGYSWGFNDANKLFFEAEGANGPLCMTSNLVLGKKNLVGLVYNGASLSFCSYDFGAQEVMWDEQTPSATIFTARPTGVLCAPSVPNYAYGQPFVGLIDEYAIFNEAFSPTMFAYLCSGLVSNLSLNSGSVQTITENVITGYGYVLTGATGIVGYTSSASGSGVSPFGTGNYQNCWTADAITGYLTSGSGLVPLSGTRLTYLTGDTTASLTPDFGLINSFIFDEISMMRRVEETDFTEIHILPTGLPINRAAGFDSVRGQFQLDGNYAENGVHLFINGLSQLSTGYSITGNGFVSGAQLSGDYRLNGPYVDSTGRYDLDDYAIYDGLSGRRSSFYDTGIQTGVAINWSPSGNLVFLEGQLLASGLDYVTSAGLFQWKTDTYIGDSGLLVSFEDTYYTRATGIPVPSVGSFSKGTPRVFFNGQRQRPQTDYLENSTLDLINRSGVFENVTTTVYNNESGYFE